MNWFWQECLRGIEVGTQTAEATLILQFDGVFWFDDVWEVNGSCNSLVMMCVMYLITLFLCL